MRRTARPMTRSLAAVAILTLTLRGCELPRLAPLDGADVNAFCEWKHHSSMSPG